MIAPITAIVLAAGAGRRFGGGKLLATLDGRPILQHVLDALAAAGIDDPFVVVGGDAGLLDRAIEWRASRRVANPDPERGLAGSLHIGWRAAMADTPAPAAVLVVLGDQPRLDPRTIAALCAQALDSARPVVVALHADGARNPVRLEPAAADLVAAATGDRGLGPLLDARPALIRTIQVAGANPDIDEPADLVALLAEDWATRVRDNAAQVERVREAPDGRDFYGPVTRMFVADPARVGDPVLDALVEVAMRAETWLDIGAGAGRYALPLAGHVAEVIALDPSPSMLDALRTAATAHGIDNVRAIEGRWPADADLRAALGDDPVADVALIAHVGYDVEAIEPFIDAMEAAARRACVAILMDQSPASVAGPFWPIVHGEERVPLPALPQFVELLRARGRAPVVARLAGERRRWADRAELLAFLRRQLWTRPDSGADGRLRAAIDARSEIGPDGTVVVSDAPMLEIGIVRWEPGRTT